MFKFEIRQLLSFLGYGDANAFVPGVNDLMEGGYEYIDARKINVHTEDLTTDIEAFYNYIKYRNILLENKGKYDVLIIDGLSDLDKMAELGGTLAYMDSIIGKNLIELKNS